MNGADKQDSVITLLMYRTRISCDAPTLEVMYSAFRSADPGLAVAVPDVVGMHGQPLFFDPVAHGNDLGFRHSGMQWGPIRMDVSGKNERHVVTLLAHTLADELGHCFVTIIDLRIKEEE